MRKKDAPVTTVYKKKDWTVITYKYDYTRKEYKNKMKVLKQRISYYNNQK